MTIRPIIQPDNPILRKKALRVTDFGKEFQTLVDDMIETMFDAPGVGLAAPQVAVSLRVVVIQTGDAENEDDVAEYGEHAGKVFVVANPKIIKASHTLVSGVEACLSIPGYYGEVDRHESLVVTAQDRYGKDFRIKVKGWLARIFQHELDHLDGRLYTDIANTVWDAKEMDRQDDDIPNSD
jgi:peptide deformylase